MDGESGLIRRIQRYGSRKAADLLVRGYYEEIYVCVCRQVGNREDAMDLTQEIFIAALQSIGRYDSKKSAFRTWLHAIAAHKVIDHRRTGHVTLLPLEDDCRSKMMPRRRDLTSSQGSMMRNFSGGSRAMFPALTRRRRRSSDCMCMTGAASARSRRAWTCLRQASKRSITACRNGSGRNSAMIVDEKIPMPAPEEIDRAVEHIAEEGLGKGTAAGRKRLRTRLLMLGGAAVIALVLAVGIPLFRKSAAKVNYPGVETVQAVRPAATAKNMSADEFNQSEAAFRWMNAQKAAAAVSLPLQEGMRPFYEGLMAQMLSGTKDNAVCSPISIYLALSMLAEVTAGGTQKQILDVLNVPDTETLRKNAAALWESNYSDSPAQQSRLANSFWLNDHFNCNRSVLRRLADMYHADSFIGVPGSDAMDKALRKWTDDNTGGLLAEHVKDLKLDRDTVLALVSAIYYPMDVYEGEHFTSVALPMKTSGFVYICLPKEGTDAGALAADPELLDIVHMNDHWTSGYNTTVCLSLPKFSVSGKTDLIGTLRSLGITDAMDEGKADFTPLAAKKEEAAGLHLGRAEHAAKLSIDEEGVVGAAYTMFMIPTAGWPERIELTVDRPFFFLVTGQDNSILFAGVVNDLE